MKICVVGTGYVGLVSGVCFADVGNDVICVDKNVQKVDRLRGGETPIYEPNLVELLKKNIHESRLSFTTDLAVGIKDAQICFVCVDTPPDADGKADLSSVTAVANELGECIESPLMVVNKSTVPVGTAFLVKELVQAGLKKRNKPLDQVKIASNPEFLKEGDALNDFLRPDRVVVGVEDHADSDIFHSLYAPFMMKGDRVIVMDVLSAELTKYASNAMLASRISFMNDLSRLAEKIGADISKVRMAMGKDPRIGSDFLYPGIGYGGSCFPKDVKALVQIGREYGESLSVVEATDNSNEAQKAWFWNKIKGHFNGNVSGLKFAVWGGAFKPNTDDIRFAPALYLVDQLLSNGAKVSLFDPVAMDNIKRSYADRIEYASDAYSCLANADALILATEWNEFRSPDLDKMISLMKKPVVFDGRNVYSQYEMNKKGFVYHCVGVGQRAV